MSLMAVGKRPGRGQKAAVALRANAEPEQLIFLDWLETLGRWIGKLLIFGARLGLIGLLALFVVALLREYNATDAGDGFPWFAWLFFWLIGVVWVLPVLRRRRYRRAVRHWWRDYPNPEDY